MGISGDLRTSQGSSGGLRGVSRSFMRFHGGSGGNFRVSGDPMSPEGVSGGVSGVT